MSQEQTAVSDSTTIDKDDINARLMAVLESDQDTPEPPEEEQDVVEEITDEVIDESQDVEEEAEESEEVEDPTEESDDESEDAPEYITEGNPAYSNPFQSKKLSLDTCGNPITPRRRKLLPNSVRLLKIKQQLTNPHLAPFLPQPEQTYHVLTM